MSQDLHSLAAEYLLGFYPSELRPVALHEPVFGGNEKAYLSDCVESGWVSSAGSYVEKVEDSLKSITKVKNAVAVVNGTSALHMCLILAGVKGLDEVLVPAFTFVATANSVSYCGATPHFVDSEKSTLGVDPIKLDNYLSEISSVKNGHCINKKTGNIIRALVVMHTFGHPARLDELLQVCQRYSIELIEDAAEAIGSEYKGRHVGQHGLLSAFSFNGNKTVTAGGGGAILTNNKELAFQARHLTTTARVLGSNEFIHDAVGYNYRMPNINAALLLGQLECLDSTLLNKRKLVARYKEYLKDFTFGELYLEPQNCLSNYWLNALMLKENCELEIGTFLAALNNLGIGARPAWRLMHLLPMYLNCQKMDLSCAENLAKRIVCLPSSSFL
jgi:perosamine synthetase